MDHQVAGPRARRGVHRRRARRRGARAPAAARSWRCRTAATGTWPGCGSTNTYGRFATVAERLKPESLYKRFVDYRESLGFEVLPADRRRAAALRDPGRAAARQRAGLPDVRPRPDQVRRAGRPLRRADDAARRTRQAGAWRPAPRCCRCTRYYEPDVAVTDDQPAAGHLVGRRRRPSPRRWPTGSPPTSPPTPPTGTCCSRSGSPTCPTSAAPGSTRAGSGPDADRDGVPVLVRRPRRRAGPRAAARRGDARLRAPRQRAGAVVAGGATCPTTSSPAARPFPSRTTDRWRGCGSAPPPTARSRSGSSTATSTCCTCTSPTRRACRCWR